MSEQKRSLLLTAMCGVGPLGERVAERLTDIIGGFPEALQLGIRVAHARGADASKKLQDLRLELVDLKNTETLESMGWYAQGSRLDQLKVCMIVVWEEGSETGLPDLSWVEGEHLGDVLHGVCVRPSLHDVLTRDGDQKLECFSTIDYIVPKLETGQQIDPSEFEAAIAGFLSLYVLFDATVSSREIERKARTFGFAGKVGLSGDALAQMAAHISHDLLARHLENRELPPDLPAGQDLARWLSRHSPEELLKDLLIPTSKGGCARSVIPVVTRWIDGGSGRILETELDDANLAITLLKHKMETWPEEVRGFAHAFSMTHSVRWKMIVEEAAQRLSAQVADRLVPDLLDVANRLPHSIAHLRRALDKLKERIATPRSPIEVASVDFDGAVDDLQTAIQERPNPFWLVLKTAMWALPAIVLGSLGLDVLFTGLRGVIFPVGWAGLIVVLATALVLQRIASANRRIQRVRDRALRAMMGQQEAILSENLVGYLSEVVTVLETELVNAEAKLDQLEATWRHDLETLASKTAIGLEAPLTLEPVLTTPDEYKDAVRSLGLDGETWLLDALGAGLFTEDTSGSTAASSRLLKWTVRRLETPGEVPLPDFRKLWEIRQRHRGGDSLREVVGQLWRRAAPLTDNPPNEPANLFLTPLELTDEVGQLAEGADYPDGVEVRPLAELPLLGCIRRGSF